jgi:hypothetical protein
MISELQQAADFLGGLDVELTALSDTWLDCIGFPKQAIEAELEKYKRGEND